MFKHFITNLAAKLVLTEENIASLFVTCNSISTFDSFAHTLNTLSTLHTLCTHFAHTLHTLWSHFAHTLNTLCTHFAHTLHTVCTQFAHSLHTVCTHFAHSLDTVCTQTEGLLTVQIASIANFDLVVWMHGFAQLMLFNCQVYLTNLEHVTVAISAQGIRIKSLRDGPRALSGTFCLASMTTPSSKNVVGISQGKKILIIKCEIL